jgi:hypothetical protein
MFSWEHPEDRVAMVQMNAELRHAELELLSAGCATQQLRLRFSIEDLARYAEPDTLRKAIAAARALNEYYSSIESKMPERASKPRAAQWSEGRINEAAARLAAYLREQRERRYLSGIPLPDANKLVMKPFFSPALLDRVRVLELGGAGIPSLPFYSDAGVLGLSNLPEMAHMASLTFVDLVVFNDRMTEKTLFHGLVHAVQFQVLGLERYTELFVRGHLKANSHVGVPLEVHAFALESKFDENRVESFSVEERVRLWAKDGRY